MTAYPHPRHMDQMYSLPTHAYGTSGAMYPNMEYVGASHVGLPPSSMAPVPNVPSMMFPYGVQGHGSSMNHAMPYRQAGTMPNHADGLAERLQDLQLSQGGPDQRTQDGNRQAEPNRAQPSTREGPVAGGRGGRGGRAPHGGQGSRQPPRKRKNQKGLEDNVKRTVYISYIDQQVTEEQLATAFLDCGRVVDCRICGDPNSAMRFAFIEFTEQAAAQQALDKSGTVVGTCSLRVLPSKTAIVPVNRELMPRSHEDIERCRRTVYAANIDKKVGKTDVLHFFEQLCGKINKIRLLGDFAHSTRIAFIEFYKAEGATAALNCSGALLGSLPIRVAPSKTPVRNEKDDDSE